MVMFSSHKCHKWLSCPHETINSETNLINPVSKALYHDSFKSYIFVKLINTYDLDLEASPGLLQSNPEFSIEGSFPK